MSWSPPERPKAKLSIAQAIALIEGYYAGGAGPNRPQRNNNPGNLEYHAWMGERYGARLEDGSHPRFAWFPSADTGFAALNDLLKSPAYARMSIAQAINRYAPPTENNTAGYVEHVCRWTGLNPSDIVGEAIG